MDATSFEQLLIVLKNAWDTLYEVTLKQVYVDVLLQGLLAIFWILMLIIFTLWLVKTIKYTYKIQEYRGNGYYANFNSEKMKEDGVTYFGMPLDDNGINIFSSVVAVLDVVIAIIVVIYIPYYIGFLINFLANPDWLVIQKLLALIK